MWNGKSQTKKTEIDSPYLRRYDTSDNSLQTAPVHAPHVSRGLFHNESHIFGENPLAPQHIEMYSSSSASFLRFCQGNIS